MLHHPLPPRPTVVPRHHVDDDAAALSTDDASCGSSHGSTKSEKNMADFDEDDVLERLAGNAAAAAAAGVAGGPGDELDEADMSVSYLRMGTRENEAICVCLGV